MILQACTQSAAGGPTCMNGMGQNRSGVPKRAETVAIADLTVVVVLKRNHCNLLDDSPVFVHVPICSQDKEAGNMKCDLIPKEGSIAEISARVTLGVGSKVIFPAPATRTMSCPREATSIFPNLNPIDEEPQAPSTLEMSVFSSNPRLYAIPGGGVSRPSSSPNE